MTVQTYISILVIGFMMYLLMTNLLQPDPPELHVFGEGLDRLYIWKSAN